MDVDDSSRMRAASLRQLDRADCHECKRSRGHTYGAVELRRYAAKRPAAACAITAMITQRLLLTQPRW